MKQIIFYSWQSDLPNSCNRGFIQAALEKTASAIKSDDTLEVEPVVDRDTQGVPGAPDIASSIFAKITLANIFVADVTITSRPKDGRATPNPNVLIELGYAIKQMGYERVILVFNEAFGKIEELPFDLRNRRVVPYKVASEQVNKSDERKKLESVFDAHIRAALSKIPESSTESLFDKVIIKIEGAHPSRVPEIRKALALILEKIEDNQPKKHRDGGGVEDVLESIGKTQEIVAEFSRITSAIAVMDDETSVLEVARWFGKLYSNYNLPEEYSGPTSNADYDYFKFVGYELFVSMITFLLSEQKWDLIKKVLAEPVPVEWLRHEGGPGYVNWDYAFGSMPLLADEGTKRKRVSLQADLLNERHTTGGLAAILPMSEFMAADLLLSLCGGSDNHFGFPTRWYPQSSVYLKNTPFFIKSAEQKKTADKLLDVLGKKSKEELIEQIKALSERSIHSLFWHFANKDFERIGTK
jgi:hypothetical protein